MMIMVKEYMSCNVMVYETKVRKYSHNYNIYIKNQVYKYENWVDSLQFYRNLWRGAIKIGSQPIDTITVGSAHPNLIMVTTLKHDGSHPPKQWNEMDQ